MPRGASSPDTDEAVSDWNYVEVKGRGMYVGDTLAVWNPAGQWWGEGDEKVWVDGEGFPVALRHRHRGPLRLRVGQHSPVPRAVLQPAAGGAGNVGSTDTRSRVLDAIPFTPLARSTTWRSGTGRLQGDLQRGELLVCRARCHAQPGATSGERQGQGRGQAVGRPARRKRPSADPSRIRRDALAAQVAVGHEPIHPRPRVVRRIAEHRLGGCQRRLDRGGEHAG